MLRKGMFISDRYEILDKVGSGGMSDVYKAKCHKLNRYVAIKVLKSEFSEDKNFVSKFKVEAQSAAGLSHPNIVNVFDVGEDNGLHYIVMELIEGITLKKYIERKEKLPVKEAVSILIQVSQGIEAAHNNHIIHRDIKPQNIIISKEGKVKVTDFGIARAASTNTISSNAMGSVHYISPEQAKGGFIDEKSDIYSLGITLYEMLTGRVPFEGDSTVSIALQHVQNELPSPKLYVPDLPISVEKIIEKCTQKKPDRRYLKVSSLIADLKKSLISPDEDFVQIVSVDETAATRMISDEEVSKIRKESGFERPELDIPVIGKDNEIIDNEPEYEEIEDDLEDELDEENPKLDKIIAIGGIVTAVIILIIVAFVIISIAGKGCSGSSNKENGKSTEETTLDANHTKVPPLAGLTKEQAVEELQKATLGHKFQEEYDNKIEEGYVISASKDAGEVVEKHTTITLVISKGAKLFDIPDVSGKGKDEARDELRALGLNVKVEYQASESVEVDKVIGTNPTAPEQLKYGDDITLNVSSGTDSTDVIVPEVTGLSRDAAKASLEGQGLKMGNVVEEYSELDKGKITRQDIEHGSKVPSGTTVNLWISKGAEEKPKVPNIVGMTEDAAREELEKVGLKLGNKTDEKSSDTVPKGQIISQSVAKDSQVNSGTAVDYVLSKGPQETTTAVKNKYVNVSIPKSSLGEISEDKAGEKVYIVVEITGQTVATVDVGAYNAMANTVNRKISIDKSYSAGTSVDVKVCLGSPDGEHSTLYTTNAYKVEEE